MDLKQFEAYIAEGYAALPGWVREKVRNVAFLIEDEPSKTVRQQEGLEEDEMLLGYYSGVPLAARGSDYGIGATLPDTITLYRKPIEEEADGDPAAVKHIIAETIWHEVAHHFGLDEKEVEKREDKRLDF